MSEKYSEKKFIKELYKTYRLPMFKIALDILHNDEDAEDVVQDSFLWIINNLEKISEIPCNERIFYFAKITEHLSINLMNKRNRHPIEDIDEHLELFTDENINETVFENISVSEIKEALAELSDRDYSLLYLYLFKEMPPKEISEETGIPEKNVRVYIHRARKRFIKILKKRGIDYDV